jgi:heptosyltransferase-2
MIPSRVVVVQTAFLGDVVLTLPLLTALRREAPATRIALVTTPAAAPLVREHPDVSLLLVYDKHGEDRGVAGGGRIVKALKHWDAGLALVPHRSLRSAMVVAAAGIPRKIGFDTSAGRWLFTDRVAYRRDAHEVDRNLDLLSPLHARPSARVLPRLYPNAKDREIVLQVAGKVLAPPGRKPVAVAPGSVWATKRWVPEGFIRVCRTLASRGESVVLLGGEDDAPLCGRIAAEAGEGVTSFAGSLTLMQSVALLQVCKVLLTNDSAPQHLAVAVGTPVVSIFGATVPGFGFAPIGAVDEVVEIRGLSCRPCGIHGGNACPIGTFECMEKIQPETIVAALDRVVERANAGAHASDH